MDACNVVVICAMFNKDYQYIRLHANNDILEIIL